MKYIPRLPGKNVNVTPTSPLRDFILMLCSVIVLFVFIYVVLGVTVDFMVPRISTETEKLLGEYLKTKWSGSDEFSEQEKKLQELLGNIQEQCVNLPYNLEIKVVDDKMINALALPGGRIVVLRGLLEKVESENELTFVLAHEMGHFANRDHLSELGRGLVFMALGVGVFGPNSFIGNQVGKLLQVSEMSFSRKHESNADEFALGIQNCFYGHVAGAGDFFEHTSKMEEKRFTGHYLSTHPESRQRISDLDLLARERGYVQKGKIIAFRFDFSEKGSLEYSK